LALLLGGKAELLPKVATRMSRGLKTEKCMKRDHFHPNLLLASLCIPPEEVLLQSHSFLALLLRQNLKKVTENGFDQNFEPSRAVEILNKAPSVSFN